MTRNPQGTGAVRDEVALLFERLYARRFFRKRPECSPRLRSLLQDCLAVPPIPMRLLFLWGVHAKLGLNSDDSHSMNFLEAFRSHLSQCLSAAPTMTVVVCDAHAKVNCIDPRVAERYALDTETEAAHRGWDTIRMTQLWSEAGISLDQILLYAQTLNLVGERESLVFSAKRLYNGAYPEEGARRYLAARLLEQPILTSRFAGYIHVNPTDPSLHYLQPDLPEFNVWTAKRGFSMKPWFHRATP